MSAKDFFVLRIPEFDVKTAAGLLLNLLNEMAIHNGRAVHPNKLLRQLGF